MKYENLCENYGKLIREALDNEDWKSFVDLTQTAVRECPNDSNPIYALAMLSYNDEIPYSMVEELIMEAEKLEPKDSSITPRLKGQAILIATQVKIRELLIKNKEIIEVDNYIESILKAYENKKTDDLLKLVSGFFKNHSDDKSAWCSIALVYPFIDLDINDLTNILAISQQLKHKNEENGKIIEELATKIYKEEK